VSAITAVVMRLDGGGAGDRGDYECRALGCSWTAKLAERSTPRQHLDQKHGGGKVVRCEPRVIRRPSTCIFNDGDLNKCPIPAAGVLAEEK
jgi:hypothetical protein